MSGGLSDGAMRLLNAVDDADTVCCVGPSAAPDLIPAGGACLWRLDPAGALWCNCLSLSDLHSLLWEQSLV